MKLLRSFVLIACALLALPAWAQRVMIFPLVQEQGPPSANWIGTGLAVALDESLTRGGIPNISYEGLRRYYEQGGLVDDPAFNIPSQIGLARQLGAGVLVSGTYRVEGESLDVHLRALAVSGDLKVLGSWQDREDLQSLLALTRKMGEKLFLALGRAWAPPPDVSPVAFESYIRGRIAADPTLQEVYFRKATEIQPDYYDAACCLAITLRATGRLTEGTKLLEDLQSKTYSKAYLGLSSLAEARMEEGRLAEARQLLLASLKAEESPAAHIDLARLYAKQGKSKEALTELVMAEKFGTDQDEIEALRRQLPPPAPQPGQAPPAKE